MSNFLSRIFNPFSKTREERKIAKILSIAKKYGNNEQEINIIQSVLKLKFTNTRDVMVPRVDVHAINIHNYSDIEENLLGNDSYSRIPIYDNDVDNILGILHTKDYFLEKIHLEKMNNKKIDIKKLLSKAYFIPESKPILSLLQELQIQHIHIAIVVDEYGGFSGIVTLEDIIEEIIGDIQDEFDSEKQDCIKLDDQSYSLDARIPLEELPKEIEIYLDEEHEDVETIGGYLLSELRYIPKLNQKVKINEIIYHITEKRKNSILRIKVILPSNTNDVASK